MRHPRPHVLSSSQYGNLLVSPRGSPSFACWVGVVKDREIVKQWRVASRRPCSILSLQIFDQFRRFCTENKSKHLFLRVTDRSLGVLTFSDLSAKSALNLLQLQWITFVVVHEGQSPHACLQDWILDVLESKHGKLACETAMMMLSRRVSNES